MELVLDDFWAGRSSRAAAGERAAAGTAEARECSGVIIVHSGQ